MIAVPPEPTKRLKIQWAGPGVIMAVSGIGASDVIAATVGGATYGTALFWAVVLGTFFKFVLTEGLARWQLATRTTIMEGWSRHLPRWVLVTFICYLMLWAIAVSGALVSGCGLAIENITSGAVPFVWGALAHAVVAFLFIYTAHAARFASIMKPLIAIMFVSVVVCAGLTFRDPGAALAGLFVPTIPSGGGPYVLSLIGGIGGSLTLLSYSYLLREEGLSHASNLSRVRLDLAIAYLFTAIFGLSIMTIAARVFHGAGIAITDSEAVSRMAGQLAEITGPAGFYIYSIGFWAAVIASLVGVWQTTPNIFADCWSLLNRRSQPQAAAGAGSKSGAYLVALCFMAAVAVPFAFMRRPLLLVVAFTILGSLFIPFLAATLLYLNNRVPWPSSIGHNRVVTNIVLGVLLLFFVMLGGIAIRNLF